MDNKKSVILLASFGTSILRASEASYDVIQKELAEAAGLNVLQVYTDDDTAKAVDGIDGRKIYTVEDGIQAAIVQGYTDVVIVPVFFAEGELYSTLRSRADFWRDRIDIRMTDAVMYSPASVEETADLLIEALAPNPEHEYILAGHEAAAYNHQVYDLLDEKLKEKGWPNMKVVKLNERDCVGQAAAHLKERHTVSRDAQVEIVPLLVAWGDYMAGELYNSNSSFMWQLRRLGYRTVFSGKGLGEYAAFRKIYPKRYWEVNAK